MSNEKSKIQSIVGLVTFMLVAFMLVSFLIDFYLEDNDTTYRQDPVSATIEPDFNDFDTVPDFDEALDFDEAPEFTLPDDFSVSVPTTLPFREAQVGNGPQSSAIDKLLALVVLPEECSGYDRNEFPHWTDIDGDGYDAREQVLLEEQLADGTWYSAFDGETVTNPSDLDIDHLVPLKEAYCSGSDLFFTNGEWDLDIAEAYANDTTTPEALIAVTAASNRSKGASDPASWISPAEDYRCTYLEDWVEVKYSWGLSVDEQEANILYRDLSLCAQGEIPAGN